MTTIAMMRVQATLFLVIGATWCSLGACDNEGGGWSTGQVGAGRAGGGDGDAPGESAGGRNAGGGPAGDRNAGGGNAGGRNAGGGNAVSGNAAGGNAAGGSQSPGPHWAVQSVDGGGSGCPDLVVGNVSYDAATGALKVQYAKMSLSYPDGGAIQNTNCVAALSLALDPGWQMAAAKITAHGSAKLDSGAKGRETTRTFFAGTPSEATAMVMLGGPYDGTYHEVKSLSADEQVWSSCGGSAVFSVDASMNLQVPAVTPGMAGIRLHEVTVEIAWRPCQ